jgi:hypothetical protein
MGIDLSEFKTINSLISYQMTIPIMNVNGKFWKALRALEKDNEFIKKYNEQIELYGHIPYFKIPDVIYYYKVDPSDYFIKRILIKSIMY